MMHGLPHGPAAGAVRGVQLRIIEPAGSLAKMRGSGRDVCDQARPALWIDRLLKIEFPDRITQIHVSDFTSGGPAPGENKTRVETGKAETKKVESKITA